MISLFVDSKLTQDNSSARCGVCHQGSHQENERFVGGCHVRLWFACGWFSCVIAEVPVFTAQERPRGARVARPLQVVPQPLARPLVTAMFGPALGFGASGNHFFSSPPSARLVGLLECTGGKLATQGGGARCHSLCQSCSTMRRRESRRQHEVENARIYCEADCGEWWYGG